MLRAIAASACLAVLVGGTESIAQLDKQFEEQQSTEQLKEKLCESMSNKISFVDKRFHGKYYIGGDGKVFLVVPENPETPWIKCRMEYKGTLGVQFKEQSCSTCEITDQLLKIEGDHLVMYTGFPDGRVTKFVRATAVR